MNSQQIAERYFRAITAYPRTVVALGLTAMIGFATFVPKLRLDTNSEAFIPKDHPSVVYRDRVKEVFGLDDPIVVAVVDEAGVFDPHTLGLVRTLTERIQQIPGVDPDRVTSIATENDVRGTEDGMIVEPFYEGVPTTQAAADHVRDALLGYPLYLGSLVAEDGTAALIVVELLDRKAEGDVYLAITELARTIQTEGEQIHVAGEGAIAGYLGRYIDADAKRLNAIAAVLITVVLFLAYGTLRGAVLPNLIVFGAIAIAIGSMAGLGVPFFVITNALPVILIAIAVADTVHILAQYYEEVSQTPDAPAREIVVRTMVALWRPVTFTSVTDIAGFFALSATSSMPPMIWFGIFASAGVLGALVLSVTFIPAALTLLPVRPARFLRFHVPGRPSDGFGRAMSTLGRVVTRHPTAVLASAAAVVAVGVFGLIRLEVEEERIQNFLATEPIRIADGAINTRLDGTNTLDVVIETDESEGLFQPDRLRRIEQLQRFLESLPHVKGTTSIVDLLTEINQAMSGERPEAHRLPDDADLVAQYVLLYTASASPTDFEEFVDSDYRLANVRARMDTGLYSIEREIIPTVERYIAEHFSGENGMTANVAGRVNVDYHWVRRLAREHAGSVAAALLAVWAVITVSFGSITAGTIAVFPVFVAVLLVYGVMGVAGIWLGIGTSMFATIAIGTSVDFSIHTLDRLIVLVREERRPLGEALEELFPTTGRALLFSFLALFLGFGVLTTSTVPPLFRFGLLVTVCAAASFVGSLTIIPALVGLLRPAFLRGPEIDAPRVVESHPERIAAGFALGLLLALSGTAMATELPSGLEVAQKVNARNDGTSVSRTLVMEMTDRNGTTRTRTTRGFRKYYGADKRSILFYVEPRNVKDTAFLTWDHADPARDDDQWLYLPAARKVRRISSSDRGDYFLGTDFTYEEIKKETKVAIEDYDWKTTGTEVVDGVECLVVEATPVSAEIARELGHSRVVRWVDPKLWMGRKARYWDIAGNEARTVSIGDIREVAGIWTAHRMIAEHHKTGHTTRFRFEDVDYAAPVDDDVFTERALRRGP